MASTTDDEANPMDRRLDSSGLKAWKRMKEQSFGKGLIVKGTRTKPYNPMIVAPFDGLELEYDRPEGFALISRTCFPLGDQLSQWQKCVNETFPGCNTAERDEYICYLQKLKPAMADFARSRLTIHLLEQIKVSDLRFGDQLRKVHTIKELWHRFLKEDFTKDDCKRYFDIFYKSITPAFLSKLQYQNMARHTTYETYLIRRIFLPDLQAQSGN